MEKKNSNIIIRNDGKQFVGYICDLQIKFAEMVQEKMKECVSPMVFDDEKMKEIDRAFYLWKDLMGYTDKDALVKVTLDDDGYWYVSFVY